MSLTEFLASRGVHARALKPVVDLLNRDWQTLDALVRAGAVPRRTVEELLAALDEDGEQGPRGWRIPPSANVRIDTPPPAPEADARSALSSYLDGVPRPVRALDHVQADLDTMLRRARWLDETYALDGAHLVCVGDHDLTALSACTLRPSLRATVVDVDEDLLAYVAGQAAARGLDVRCLHADLRFGLPPGVLETADLVFTDPPYTPEGMRLFLARAIQASKGPETRILAAYGYSDRTPALGLKVQQEIAALGLAAQAILPDFNRYHGAQAVGGTADLYVLQPTAGSPAAAANALKSTKTTIYTHGPQSVEASAASPTEALLRLAKTGKITRPGWSEAAKTNAPLAYDLTGDPGPWLARTLLAAPRTDVAALVPNNHPDITAQKTQQALTALVAAKFTLTFHRSQADGKHAVVTATPVEAHGPAAALLDRPHGKLGNILREALIAETPGLTKREARTQVADLVGDSAQERLIDLPRAEVAALLARL